MAITRVKCIECNNMILPQTAQDNGGLCGQCAKVPAYLREAQRKYDRELASGTVFRPNEAEFKSEKQPIEFGNESQWSLEPEYYAEESATLSEVLQRASNESKGNVFLVSDLGGRLNLSFTERLAVCEYQNQDSGDFLYAFTDANLREQVAAEEHVVQACPCCGVGMLWFPSRFHMPRRNAFEIVANVVSNRTPHDVRWLDSGDFSYTLPGAG